MMRRLLLGFIAGFLATIIFHQIALQLLHMAGVVPRAAWAMRPVPPFGVPAVISLSFWGGVWGAIMIPIIDRFRDAKYWIWAIVFGAIARIRSCWRRPRAEVERRPRVCFPGSEPSLRLWSTLQPASPEYR